MDGKIDIMDIKLENLKLYCRACLEKLSDYKHNVDETPLILFKLFKKYTGFKKTENDLYPNSICELCFEKFQNFDQFLEMSKKSSQFLKGLLKTTIKTEPKTFIPDEIEESYQQENSESYEQEDSTDYILKPDISLSIDPLEEENTVKEIIIKTEIETEDTMLLQSEHVEIKPTTTRGKEMQQNDTNNKSDLTCEICQKTYASPSSLTVHKRTHLDKRPFPCPKCERGFNKKFRLNEHLKKIHAENITDIVCKFGCKIGFKSEEALNKHYNKKHASSATFPLDENKMKTQNSDKFSAPREIVQHLPTKTEKIPAIDKLYICKICLKNYSSSTALRIHMRLHDEKRAYQCDKCERGFNAKARLKSHMEEDHAENPVEIQCKYGCGKTFQRKHTALAHYRLKHILPEQGIAPKDYSCICEECGKVCKNKYFLNEHRFQHVPYDELPYRCEPCNRRFRSKKHMKRHLVRHEPIRKYECPHCGFRKATREELRKHINNHTREILYPCPICGKTFTTAENMRRHKRVVHEGVKNYKCRFCEESFGKAETRKHHEMRHTGERPHKCELCEKSFIQLVALKAHMKTHNKIGRLNQDNNLKGNSSNLLTLTQKQTLASIHAAADATTTNPLIALS